MVKILNYAKNINRSSNDNLLINGNFDVWQRGSSFYANGFTADRWYVVFNGSNKVSRLQGNIGLDNATNNIRLTTLSSGSYPVLSQAVDSDISSALRGKTAIFSFYAKKPSDSNWTGLVYGKVYYSTEFNSLANGKAEISDAAFSGTLVNDTWTLYSKSFTVPTNASTLLVEISPSGGLNSSSIIDIGRAKLELGSVVTNFKPNVCNAELNKCKKFYQRVEAVLRAGTGAGNSSRKFGVSTPLPVLPRSSNPKISVAANQNTLIDDFTTNISNEAYLNVTASSKSPHSELNLTFLIDDEIPYGKVPGIINSVTTIRGSGKVDIDWNPPTNSDDTISYSILYGTNPSETTNIISFTDSSGSITGLVDSSPYYFKLYSTNSFGQSDFSNTFEVAPAYTSPSIVSSLTGIWGFDTNHISWTIPTGNGGSPITGYRIDRSMYSNFPDVATTPNYNSTFYVPYTSLSFNISKFSSELTSTGNYHFRVAAMNLAGTGTPRSISVPKTVPTAPINLSTTAGDASIVINYLPPTGNGGNTISLVTLERATGTGFISAVSSNHVANYQPITVSSLTNSTTYYFRMRAYNELGYGPYSSTVSATPASPLTVPSSPSISSVSWVDDDTVQVLLNAPSNNGGTPIINYTVFSSSGSGFATNLTTSITQNSIGSISFDVPITGNYNTFYFRARANNSVGSSNNSSIVSLAKQVPNSPPIYSISAGDASVTYSYTVPISRGSPITGYNIQYSTDSTFNTSVTNIFTTSTSRVVTSLTNNTTYCFRVRALNLIGTGLFTGHLCAIPSFPYSAPTAPSNPLLTILQVPVNNNFNMLPENLSNLNATFVNYNTMYGVRVTTPFTGGLIFGVNPYVNQSDLRTSAVHAGALTALPTGDPNLSNVSLLLNMDGTNGSKKFNDVSKNNYTITAVNNAQISTLQSKFGGSSAKLNGPPDELHNNTAAALNFNLPNSAFGDDFTVEMWINLDNTNDQTLIAAPYPSPFFPSVLAYQLIIQNGVLYSNVAGVNLGNTYTLPNNFTGVWRHIAACRSNFTHRLFVDGIQRNSVYDNLPYNSLGFRSQIYGYMDELRVTKGIARYTSNFTPPTLPFSNFATSTGIVYAFVTEGLSQYYPITRNNITSLQNGAFNISYEVVGSNNNASCDNFTFGTATGVSTNSYIPRISWTPPFNNGGLPITGYEIQYAADSSFSSQLTTAYTSGNIPFRTRCIAHSGVNLYARVRAYNATGVSPWSSTASYLGKGLGAPLPPISASATAIGTTGINLSWTAPSGPIGSGFDSSTNITYRLQYWNQASPTSRTSIDYGAGTTYANVPISGPGTYTLQLQTKNSVYFSNSLNTVLTVNPSLPAPVSWVFTTSTPCCGAADPKILPNVLRDNLNVAGSTFSSCAGGNGLAYITADFGSIKNVTSIKIRPHYTYGAYYLNHTKLQYSTDGSVWTTLTDFQTFTNPPVFKDSITEIPINTNINARYIRLISGNISCIDLSEFKFA